MKEKLIALLKSLGLLTDDKVEAVSKELDKLELEKKPDAPIDASKITDPALKAVIEGLQNQNASLSQQIKSLTDTLAAEQTDRAKAIKVQQDQAKKDRELKVTELVTRALKEGKIVKAKEEWLKKYAENDLTAAEEWVKEAPVDKNFKPEPTKDNPPAGGGDDKKAKGPLGNVNATILGKVMEQSSIN
ncbi:phage protease [Zoogloea sp.]|uniref:phage protease n=1 Tax=Zoogloea sp. TaxID=49181 RepID=UPI001416204A|nr:MAG: hypothetical protein F9K15_12760 [Zoogloea sp.]